MQLIVYIRSMLLLSFDSMVNKLLYKIFSRYLHQGDIQSEVEADQSKEMFCLAQIYINVAILAAKMATDSNVHAAIDTETLDEAAPVLLFVEETDPVL